MTEEGGVEPHLISHFVGCFFNLCKVNCFYCWWPPPPHGVTLSSFDMGFLNLAMTDEMLLISVILLNDGITVSIIFYEITDAQFIINKCIFFCKSFLFKHWQCVQWTTSSKLYSDEHGEHIQQIKKNGYSWIKTRPQSDLKPVISDQTAFLTRAVCKAQ